MSESPVDRRPELTLEMMSQAAKKVYPDISDAPVVLSPVFYDRLKRFYEREGWSMPPNFVRQERVPLE